MNRAYEYIIAVIGGLLLALLLVCWNGEWVDVSL
jgi:hypothetical protein